MLELRGDVATMGASLAAFVAEEDKELTKKIKLNMAKSSFGVILKAEQLQESGVISDEFFRKTGQVQRTDKTRPEIKKGIAGEFWKCFEKPKSFLNGNAIVEQTEIDQELARSILYQNSTT